MRKKHKDHPYDKNLRTHAGALDQAEPSSSADPHPPPPGVSMRTRSPRRKRVLPLPGMRSMEPSARIISVRPGAASPPPARQTVRSRLAPVSEQGHGGVGQHFDFSDDAVAAAMFSFPTAARAQRILH